MEDKQEGSPISENISATVEAESTKKHMETDVQVISSDECGDSLWDQVLEQEIKASK